VTSPPRPPPTQQAEFPNPAAEIERGAYDDDDDDGDSGAQNGGDGFATRAPSPTRIGNTVRARARPDAGWGRTDAADEPVWPRIISFYQFYETHRPEMIPSDRGSPYPTTTTSDSTSTATLARRVNSGEYIFSC